MKLHEPTLKGTALHNPQLLSRDELAREFVVRQGDLERLVTNLRERIGHTPQHHLVLGHRGMGKTTLLHRLSHVVEDDPTLHAALIPLVFQEEQYNVGGLDQLWLNTLDALSDRLELWGEVDRARQLDGLIDSLQAERDPARLTAAALDLLAHESARLGRRLLLLVDNIDLVFQRIGADAQWALREVLERRDTFVLVAASAEAMEATYEYGRAFYDFFRVHKLGPLGLDAARTLLLAIADRDDNAQVRAVVTQHPARVATLSTLAGGNPRTLTTLYSVLATSPHGDVRSDLEGLLDRHTPLYKARFEALSPQAQQVMDALCLQWDPATARELADHTRLDVNIISSQLSRLQKDGLVDKVKARGRYAFLVTERFFNIWYLMRANRRARRKLAWFVAAVEGVFGQEELFQLAGKLLRGERRHDEAALALALADRLPIEVIKKALHQFAHDHGDAAMRTEPDLAEARALAEVRATRLARLRTYPEEVQVLMASTITLDWDTIEEFDRVDDPTLMLLLTIHTLADHLFLDPTDLAHAKRRRSEGAQLGDDGMVGDVILTSISPQSFATCISAVGEFVLSATSLISKMMLSGAGAHLRDLGIPIDTTGDDDDDEDDEDDDEDDDENDDSAPHPLGTAIRACQLARLNRPDAVNALCVTLADEPNAQRVALWTLTGLWLARNGHATAAAAAMDAHDLADRHRPLRELFRGISEGPEVLNAVSPELAEATRTLLRLLQPPTA